MSEISRANVDVWKRSFRRRYFSNLAALRALADEIASEAGEVVTITSTNLEGGGGSGVVTGNKLEMLAAVEELLDERRGTDLAAAPPLRMIYPVFSGIPH